MDKSIRNYLTELENIIKTAYQESPTIDEAEKLAARFLGAQIHIGDKLRTLDLDYRMKKNGLKQVKAQVYLENAAKGEKKPSDVMLAAIVDTSHAVGDAQTAHDDAETIKNNLENWLSVCRDAHIYFRGIAKGRFE